MYANKYWFTASLLIVYVVNSSLQCNKRIACAEVVYNFEIGVKAYPDKDSINIGDTIWLSVNQSVNLKDVSTGRMVNYSNAANLGSAIAFHKLSDANQFTIGAAKFFEFKLVNGAETNNADPTYLHEYLFEEKTDYYLFKLGIIPKEKGVYGLIFSNAGNVYRKNDKCTKANFTLNFKNTNQHYYLNPNFQGGPIPVGGNYYFKVN